jgi:hypothetical protein
MFSYEVLSKYYRSNGSKSSAVVQFRYTVTDDTDIVDMGNSKKDLVWVRYAGLPEDFEFKGTVEECLNKVNLGVLNKDWGEDGAGESENWSQCAAWSYTLY